MCLKKVVLTSKKENKKEKEKENEKSERDKKNICELQRAANLLKMLCLINYDESFY